MQDIDTALPLRLPWPSDLQIVPAGPFLRLFALLLDHLILGGLFLIATIAAILTSIRIPVETAQGIILFLYAVLIFAIYNGYFFLGELIFRGQTPGKMIFGLRVLRPDGASPDVFALLIRNLLRPADMFPFLAGFWVFHLPSYAIGGIASLVLPYFRRGGDLAAGTIVIYERSVVLGLFRRPSPPDSPGGVQRRVYPLRRPDPVLLEAVSRFVARRDGIPPARRQEIAMQFYPELKAIFSWSGPEPGPEELIQDIYRDCVQGERVRLSPGVRTGA